MAAYGTKGEFAAMRRNGPIPGVLLTLLARLARSRNRHGLTQSAHVASA